MKHEALDCYKFKALKHRLGWPRYRVVGLLETLWQFTAKNTPQGNIGKYADEQIAEDLEFRGDFKRVVRALISTGWLDESAEHRLVIHDWGDHAPEYIKKRLRRAKKPIVADTGCRAADTGRQRLPTKPNLTKPNPTEPVPPTPQPGPPDSARTTYEQDDKFASGLLEYPWPYAKPRLDREAVHTALSVLRLDGMGDADSRQYLRGKVVEYFRVTPPARVSCRSFLGDGVFRLAAEEWTRSGLKDEKAVRKQEAEERARRQGESDHERTQRLLREQREYEENVRRERAKAHGKEPDD
ncbi:MAG: hypothetical protein GF393_10755, partial [Armatimonadia bacterium]|nr:hypothetical protein [Armatimonadia bacterium]